MVIVGTAGGSAIVAVVVGMAGRRTASAARSSACRSDRHCPRPWCQPASLRGQLGVAPLQESPSASARAHPGGSRTSCCRSWAAVPRGGRRSGPPTSAGRRAARARAPACWPRPPSPSCRSWPGCRTPAPEPIRRLGCTAGRHVPAGRSPGCVRAHARPHAPGHTGATGLPRCGCC